MLILNAVIPSGGIVLVVAPAYVVVISITRRAIVIILQEHTPLYRAGRPRTWSHT